MLYVQENTHSTLLLASMLSTPPVHPQPSSSTSSRSTRVVEQLQDTLEMLQKEVISTRSQLEAARQAKAQSEQEAQTYVELNSQYRIDIQGLMQLLESKQQLLDSTKQTSVSMEAEVKRLKDEALASRKKLEELRKKEQVLERDRDLAVAEKMQIEQQQIVFRKSVKDLEKRFEREVAGLRQDLEDVKAMMALMAEHSKSVAMSIESKIRQRAAVRQELEIRLEQLRKQMQDNLHQFAQQMQAEIGSLLENAHKSAGETKDFETAVLKCRGEVNGLVARIRSFTAENVE